MKTHILLGMAAVFVLLSLTSVSAAIITVDNKYPYAGDYQTLFDAHSAASPGDTIVVYPSVVPYGAITITKQLIFYGVGFDITENFGEPYTPTSTIAGNMVFETGSQGAWLEGFDGDFGVDINTNNIIIKRNDLSFVYVANGSGSVVTQNNIVGRGPSIGYSSKYSIYSTQSSNILISNNIIINPGGSLSYDHGIQVSSSTIINNIIKAPAYSFSGSNNEVVNNIIILGSIVSDNLYRYNICHNHQLPAIYGNQNNVDMTTVFVDMANQDFHLSSNSPAAGTGENGTDMGIYGGDAPYVDGGFPGLPSILQILAPTVGSQQSGLNIQFKAKSNKE